MELASLQHIESHKLADFEADVFITALSHESRCTTVARKLEGKSCRKVALVKAVQPKEFLYHKNQSYFQDQGFEIIQSESSSPDLGILFRDLNVKSPKIELDCTCMSPRWYFEFLNWFYDNTLGYSASTLRIVYSMAGFENQEQVLKLKSLKSILQNQVAGSPEKKTALILGLGHEKGASEAIYRKVKPDLLYLLYSDPPVDKKFVEKVFVNNHTLINCTPIRNLVSFPIRNGQIIYQSLIDIILPLRDEYSIILVPHGPKILSLVSLLVYQGYPDIEVKYPKFKKVQLSDRSSVDEPIILDISFEGEE